MKLLKPSIALVMLIKVLVGLAVTPMPAYSQGASPTSDQQLARDILKELIEINTTHQFGSTKAAEAVATRLRAAGFPAADVHVLAPAEHPDSGNVVVRLRGAGREKPILFLAHLDVVEARKEDWSEGIDPFKLTERDGYFYGRGTVDIKGEAAILVANLIRLKREGFAPARDILVALTADEEGGGKANGVGWLVENRRDLIDAAYAINTDAGGGQMEMGERARYVIQTSEKSSANYRLEVKNPGGHSSMPVRDNAIYRLAEGLTRLAQFDFPVRLNEAARTFFFKMSTREKGQTAADMKAVAGDMPDPAAVKRLASLSPLYNSMMRTTCVATMLEAGHAPNALPQTARATINCRLLPDDSPTNVQGSLARVLADDQITITALNTPITAPASPLTPEVVQPIERAVTKMWPSVLIVPGMDVWGTDSRRLRRAGIPTYGASGAFAEVDPSRAHGKDERVGVQAFYEGVEFMYRLIKALSSS